MNFIWKSDLGSEKLSEFENIKRMITISVITLSGFHSTIFQFKIVLLPKSIISWFKIAWFLNTVVAA